MIVDGCSLLAVIDIAEPMQERYDTDDKYERRHKLPFTDIEQSPGNAFFDVFGGDNRRHFRGARHSVAKHTEGLDMIM